MQRLDKNCEFVTMINNILLTYLYANPYNIFLFCSYSDYGHLGYLHTHNKHAPIEEIKKSAS